MQDLEKDFDLKLRSMLDGVEEEVPQRVWQGVSSSLGRRRERAAWMRRVGAGLAAAAAVAIAVVLPLSRSDTPAVTEQPLVSEAPAPEVPEQEFQVPQGVMTASTKPSARHQSVRTSESSSASEPQAVSAVEPQVAVPDETEPESEAQTASQPTQKQTQTSPAQKKSYEAWSDPFARMAYEESHTKTASRISLSVSGITGTNDKPQAGSAGSGRMAVQGASASKESVSESGEPIYGVPVSFGLGAKFHFTDRLALGLGVDWSLLTRTFDGTYTNPEGHHVNLEGISHGVQYVGVPVNLYFDILSNDVVDLYTFVGGSVEKCVSNKYILPAFDNTLMAAPTGMTYKESVKGLQYSAALGLGVQFNINDHFGIYVDPSMRYWMGQDQPKSIRTQQPLMFSIEAGLRFEL